MRSPNPNQVDRGIIQQWNVAYEYRLPGDIAAEVAYVGTRTDGGYADLNINYGAPGGGNAARQYFAHRRHDRDQRLGGAHQEPLPRPADRGEPSAAATACC